MSKSAKRVTKAVAASNIKQAHDRLNAALMVRNSAMNQLATVLEVIWGPRCSTRNQGGCPACAAWAAFDAMETMTDTVWFQDISTEDAMKIIKDGKRNA